MTWDDRTAPIDDEWDDFVSRWPGGYHTQTSRWGSVQSRRGWTVVRRAVSEEGRLLGGFQMLTKAFSGLGRVGYVDRGPMGAPEIAAELVDELSATASRHGLRLLLAQPPEGAQGTELAMRRLSFGDTHIKTSLAATTTVDLTAGEEAVLAGMKSKTRYNVRQGLKAGVTVREGGKADVGLFHEMLEATARRQGFTPNSKSHLDDMFTTLDDWCRVFLAEFEGVPIAGMLAMTFGDTVVYKRGAWSGAEGARRPNEVMHWEAIRWAIRNGFRRYDFDGIEPEAARLALAGEKLTGDVAESVTRFKLGFGGDVVLLPETLSYLPNRLARFAYDRVYPSVAGFKPVRRLVKRIRVA